MVPKLLDALESVFDTVGCSQLAPSPGGWLGRAMGAKTVILGGCCCAAVIAIIVTSGRVRTPLLPSVACRHCHLFAPAELTTTAPESAFQPKSMWIMSNSADDLLRAASMLHRHRSSGVVQGSHLGLE